MFQTAFKDEGKAREFSARLVSLSYKFEFISNHWLGQSTYIFTYYALQELK